MKFSLIIVSARRPFQLDHCLNSISAALSAVSVEHEILLFINNCTDSTMDVARKYNLTWESSSISISPAQARNHLLKKATGDWIVFVDDDAWLSPDYFTEFLKIVNDPFQVFGGPNLTPSGSSAFQSACGKALASWFGGGPCSHRYSDHSKDGPCTESSLILCNLIISKRALNDLEFPENFLCGEENDLLENLKRKNIQFYYSSKLRVYHDRRKTFGQFSKQIYKYGIGRGQNLKKGHARWFHFAPLALILLASACPTTLFAYLFADFIVTFKNLIQGQTTIRESLMMLILFPTIHLGYAFGILRGLLL